MKPLPRRLLAGALVGFSGALSFGLAHALLIKPVVPPFVVGALVATPVGVAAAWAWNDLQRQRGARGAHVGLALAALLLPAGLVSLTLGPLDDLNPASGPARAALVLLPLPLALGLGWAWGRTWRAALGLGLAGGLLGLMLAAQTASADLRGWAGLFYAVFLGLTVAAGAALERVDARLASAIGPSGAPPLARR